VVADPASILLAGVTSALTSQGIDPTWMMFAAAGVLLLMVLSCQLGP
jgi:hypothetical protein